MIWIMIDSEMGRNQIGFFPKKKCGFQEVTELDVIMHVARVSSGENRIMNLVSSGRGIMGDYWN